MATFEDYWARVLVSRATVIETRTSFSYDQRTNHHHSSYWSGAEIAEIYQSDFSSEVLNSISTQVASPTRFCNKVFYTFHRGRAAIRLYQGNERDDVKDALEDAAKVGSGLNGVSDLEEVFEYRFRRYSSAGHWWVDEHIKQYTGEYAEPDCRFFELDVYAPEGFVHFANAVDKATLDLKNVVSQFTGVSDSIADSLRQCEGGGQPNFLQLRAAAGHVNTWSNRQERFLWLIENTNTITIPPNVPVTFEGMNRTLGVVSGVSGMVTDVTDTLNFIADMESADIPDRMTKALAVLRFISSKLPVLGQLYVSAIDTAPQLARVIQGAMQSRIDVLEDINVNGVNGVFTSERGLQPDSPIVPMGRSRGRVPRSTGP